MSIQEAEDNYRSVSEFYRGRESGRSIIAFIGCLLSVVGLASLYIIQDRGLQIAVSLFVLGVCPVSMLVLLMGGQNKDEDKVLLAKKAIHDAQKKWVESHGFKLPHDAMERLGFPILAPNQPASYGICDLIEDSEDGKLVTVYLDYLPGHGYRLRGTDGAELKPLVKQSA